MTDQSEAVLAVRGLDLSIDTHQGKAHILKIISFDLSAGKTTCLVGESGCGKSVTSLTIMGLIQGHGLQLDGQILFEGQDLLQLSESELVQMRGNRMAMIFQEPMTSLNPVLTIGDQLTEAVLAHADISADEAKERAIKVLETVHMPSAEARMSEYPHQLSGGMRQRVMIAMGLINQPSLLIADEPTTALDVTVQAQILTLIRELQQNTRTAVLLITHDLGVVANVADDVVVMYAGEIVEQGPVKQIFEDPQHPYTLGLLSAIPRIGETREELPTIMGSVPPVTEMVAGCRFSPRCPFAHEQCSETPPRQSHGSGHHSRCWYTPLEQRLPGLQPEPIEVQEAI